MEGWFNTAWDIELPNTIISSLFIIKINKKLGSRNLQISDSSAWFLVLSPRTYESFILENYFENRMMFGLEKLEVDNPVERLELDADHEITEWYIAMLVEGTKRKRKSKIPYRERTIKLCDGR